MGLRHLLMWSLVSLSVGDVERVSVCGSAPSVPLSSGSDSRHDDGNATGRRPRHSRPLRRPHPARRVRSLVDSALRRRERTGVTIMVVSGDDDADDEDDNVQVNYDDDADKDNDDLDDYKEGDDYDEDDHHYEDSSFRLLPTSFLPPS